MSLVCTQLSDISREAVDKTGFNDSMPFNFDHPVQSICLLDWISLFLQRNSGYRAEGRCTELFESPVERLYR